MVWQQVRRVLLAVAFTAAAAVAARAEETVPPAVGPQTPAVGPQTPAAGPQTPAAGPQTPAPSAPQYRTVSVQEWVPETYPSTRTTYSTESKQETYTAYRCESTPEVRTRVCTVYHQVPETKTCTRTVCVCVPCVEERTVMQNHVTCKPVTHMVRRCVDKGHWECREVPCEPSCKERLRKCFRKKKDCCDSCEPCCPPPTKTVRVWVPCKVWEEVPVTSMERVCESRPVVCKVTTYKHETRQEAYQVCTMKCVPEQKTETYTVMVSKMVPYQSTRTVQVCVPHTETVTMTRMVCKTVQKQVAVETCCESPCGETSCCHTCGHKSRKRHGCCD